MAEVEEMVRLSVRVPAETRDELAELASVSGLKMSAFLAAALVIGGRQLARQTNPEVFVTPAMIRTWLLALGMDVDKLAQQVGKSFDELLTEIKREDDREGEQREVA